MKKHLFLGGFLLCSIGLLAQTLYKKNLSGNTNTLHLNSSSSTLLNFLPADREIDWTYSGIPGGIPSCTWQLCQTTACNAILNPTGNDDAPAIQAAINSAPKNSVVLLGNGTFKTLSGIKLKNYVVLRGNGAGNTFINYEGPMTATGEGEIIFQTQLNTSYDVPDWQGDASRIRNITAGLNKNSSIIVLNNTASLTIGHILHVTQLDDPSLVTDPTNSLNCGYCGYSGNREVGQYVEVKGINGNSVSIYPPLYMPYSASLSPTARIVDSTAFIKQAGLENITITQTGDSISDNIIMYGALQCWVKNVEVKNVGSNRAGIHLQNCLENEIRNNFIHDIYNNASPDHTHGGVLLYRWSSGNRVENNIFSNISEGSLMTLGSGGNVIAYNYIHNNKKPVGYDSWMLNFPSLNHGAHPVQNLWESNVGGKAEADITHGSSSHNVLFRCNFTGYDTTYATSCVNAIYAVDLAAWNKYYSIVGCVLGRPGYSDTYDVANAASLVSGKHYIYALGVTEGIDDPTVPQTTIRWGNYDYVTNATHWGSLNGYPNDMPSALVLSQTLPTSFYRNSPPAWWTTPWGTPSWPAIGPDVAGLVQEIPAKRCFKNQNLLNNGTFNPAIAYPNDGCSTTTNIQVITRETGKLYVYPNPAQSKINIELEGKSYIKQITILNMAGQIVLQKTISGNLNSVTIDVSALPNGIYTVKAENTLGEQTTRKVSVLNH